MFNAEKLTSQQNILQGIEDMNSFGARLTGTKAHNSFISYLKDKIHQMGIETYSDPYRFNRWEEESASLTLHGQEGDEDIHVSSVWPYSGETDPQGVTGQLVYCKAKHLGFAEAKGKIAVVRMRDFEKVPSSVAFAQRASMPEVVKIPANYKGPVATAFVKFPFLAVAKACGVKAVVLVWEGMSDAMVEGQYLPFILDYQGIPALWVNETDGKTLLEAAGKGQSATLVLTASKEENARTESFYSILPGKRSDEAIIINTHTDGTNCVEENGPIALLAMMDYFRQVEHDRTLIFVFVTGHFRLPSFKQDSMQATSKWLSSHRDLWDGKKGHIKAVAGVSVEHLGCVEWKDVEGEYANTGEVDLEMTYTGNRVMDSIYYEALQGRKKLRAVTLRGHNFLHFGEGQPLFDFGIPEIALVTAPDYLCVVSDNHEMDKFDLELMYEQIETFIRCVHIIDTKPAKVLGRPDGYSLLSPVLFGVSAVR